MSSDKLIKEIDALTYNARSVLNALIRSALSSSSANGFTVTRSGIKVTLTRPLIYRLYRFYEDWQNNEFSLVTNNTNKSFDDILAEHDLVPVTDDQNPANVLIEEPTSKAIIIHSKILYLSASNINRNEDNTDNNQYWIDLVKNATNPKLLTNSAPIPLNLRTPIFNENLSTTRFLTHESYLFPYTYFSLEQLGYSGDGVDHNLAGFSWKISTEDNIRLISNKISVGNVYDTATFKTLDNREGDFSFSWGFDTHARGVYSTAGGYSSLATSDKSIVIGSNSLATSESAMTLGTNGISSYFRSSVVGGNFNTSVAENGIAFGGSGNIVGSNIYEFEFYNTTSVISENCNIDLDNCTAELVQESTSTLIRRDVVIIPDTEAATLFSVGDGVALFSFTVLANGVPKVQFYEPNGNAYETYLAVVSNVTVEGFNTVITLDRIVPYNSADGGKISVIFKASPNSKLSGTPGENSSATGTANIASGYSQLVVGKYNEQVSDALFIVGSGVGSSSGSRRNSLVIKENQLYFLGNINTNIGNFLASSSTVYGIKADSTEILIKTGVSHLNLTNTLAELVSGGGSTRILLNNDILLDTPNNITLSSNILSSSSIGSTSMSANGNFNISSAGTLTHSANNITLSWSGIFKLEGDTYPILPVVGTYKTTSKYGSFSHIIGPQAYASTNATDLFNIRYTSFFSVEQAVSDAPNLLSVGADSNKFWLLNISALQDPSQASVNYFESWQLAFGRTISFTNGDATGGRVGVRRVVNDINGVKQTLWRYLAWADDGAFILNQTATYQAAGFKLNGTGEVNSLTLTGTGFVQNANSLLIGSGGILVNNGHLNLNSGNVNLTNGNITLAAAGSGILKNALQYTGNSSAVFDFGSRTCGVLKVIGLSGTGSLTLRVQTNGYSKTNSFVMVSIAHNDTSGNGRYSWVIDKETLAPTNQFIIHMKVVDGSHPDPLYVYFDIVDSITAIYP